MNILIIGFTTEGSTDVRFLESIIRRTFEAVACECEADIEIYDVQHLPVEGSTFTDEVLRAARAAENSGVMVLCVHADADDDTDANVVLTKIKPAFTLVEQHREEVCKNLVAIVPVQMTEAWMLADKELLRQEVGTNKTYQELDLARRPETIADPKEAIKNALRVAQEDAPRRRRNRITISDLYQRMGQKLSLDKLALLPSYARFRDAVREAFVKLNYLH